MQTSHHTADITQFPCMTLMLFCCWFWLCFCCCYCFVLLLGWFFGDFFFFGGGGGTSKPSLQNRADSFLLSSSGISTRKGSTEIELHWNHMVQEQDSLLFRETWNGNVKHFQFYWIKTFPPSKLDAADFVWVVTKELCGLALDGNQAPPGHWLALTLE